MIEPARGMVFPDAWNVDKPDGPEREFPDEPSIFIDGAPDGCRCTPECGAPCWIRPGLAPPEDEVCRSCGCTR